MKMTNFEANLLEKIKTRDARVAVIGLGYVGLPLAVGFARAGFRTLGIDVDPHKVEAINTGRSYIQDVPTVEVAALVNAGSLEATQDYSVLRECDAVFEFGPVFILFRGRIRISDFPELLDKCPF